MSKNLILKAGTHSFINPNENKPGGDVGKFVLDWLVYKGVLETEDCIRYSVVNPSSNQVYLRQAVTGELYLEVFGEKGDVIELATNEIKTSSLISVMGTDYAPGTSLQTILVALSGISGGGGGGNTNLTAGHSPSTVTINSDTGTDATILNADATRAGVLQVSDFVFFNNTKNALGVSGAADFGTFTGNIISNNATAKTALQQLETAIENGLPDSTIKLVNVAIGGGHGGGAVITYQGNAIPTITKVSASIWDIVIPANVLLLSVGIYSPSGDNPGANLTININSASTIYNQDSQSLFIPMVTGLNLGSYPANYAPSTGSVNLQPRVEIQPTNGDLKLVINNFNNASGLGTGATYLKLLFT